MRALQTRTDTMIKSFLIMWFCLLLLAGCATPSSQPASSASNLAPVIISDAGVNFVNTNQLGTSLPLSPHNTPFAAYDTTVTEAISKRWYDLLDSGQFNSHRNGKVVVQFRLHSNGAVSDIKILDNNVGALLGYVCKKSIQDPAPFEKWPPDMQRMLNKDYRELTFTFYYK
jgi:hypothetical protein